MTDWVNLVGKRICQLREEHKLTQEELAEASGISPSFLGLIERGKRTPSVATLLKIAQMLDTTIDGLFNEPRKPEFTEKFVPKYGKSDPLIKRMAVILQTLSQKDKKLALKIVKQISRKT